MRTSACFGGKLKNLRRYHRSKNKKDTGQGCLKGAVDMEAPVTADCGFIQFLGPDFGFWLSGSSDRGSQRSHGNLTFSLLCAGSHAVEKMALVT